MSTETTRDALLALSDLHLGAVTRYAGILHPGPATAQILLDETRPLALEAAALTALDHLAPTVWPTTERPYAPYIESIGAKMRRVLDPTCPHSIAALGPCSLCDETCHHYSAKEQDAD